MDRKLRSPELKPSLSPDELGDDALWANAVAEVVTRRSRLTAGTFAEKGDTNVGGRLLLYTPRTTSRAVQRKLVLTASLM